MKPSDHNSFIAEAQDGDLHRCWLKFGELLPKTLWQTSYHDEGAAGLVEEMELTPGLANELLRRRLHDQMLRFMLDVSDIATALLEQKRLAANDDDEVSGDDREELHQEIIAEILTSSQRFDPRSNTSTWMWLTGFGVRVIERWFAGRARGMPHTIFQD